MNDLARHSATVAIPVWGGKGDRGVARLVRGDFNAISDLRKDNKAFLRGSHNHFTPRKTVKLTLDLRSFTSRINHSARYAIRPAIVILLTTLRPSP